MNEHELTELRQRLERLEQRVDQLTHGEKPRATDPVRTAAQATPPPLPPSVSQSNQLPPKSEPSTISRLSSISSATWIAAAGAFFILIGAIYALTVSIQRGWISPPVRVAGGLFTAMFLGYFATKRLLQRTEGRGSSIALLATALGLWMFSLYYGSQVLFLFDPIYGFAGVLAATIFAGALSARIKSSAALSCALIVAVAAPFVFSQRSGSVPTLIFYFSLLITGHAAIHYVSGVGARWIIPRLISLCTVWLLVLSAVVFEHKNINYSELTFATLALTVASLVLVWLPRQIEKPVAPAAYTVYVLFMSGWALFACWSNLHLSEEFFALPLLGYATLSVFLIPYARSRMGTQKHDMPLLLLAAGFALVAFPVAVDEKWLVLAWGLFALLTAYAAQRLEKASRSEALGVFLTASTALLLASFVWQFVGSRYDTPLINPHFTGAMLIAAAGIFISRTKSILRFVGFSVSQYVGVNAIAWELGRCVAFRNEEVPMPALAALLVTLTYAVAGASQWLYGVTVRPQEDLSKGLRRVGYIWLGVSAIKLLASDLDGADTFFRALAALGIGAVFLLSALWATRRRKTKSQEPSP